jgi:photosystem II stability/assembly factor-like uncharacterized protein
MKKSILYILTIVFWSQDPVFAQNWMKDLNMSSPNFFETQRVFEEYAKSSGESVNYFIEKDSYYAKYKRWEHFWETRVDSDGQFPDANILRTEMKNLLKEKKYLFSDKSLSNWTFAGPSTFLSNNAGGIGRVNCIAFHPTLPNTFWVGTPGGGLWKTTDAGATWSTTTDNLPVLGISDIAINYLNPSIIYIATGDGETVLVNPGSIRSVGVLKSIDGGITFNETGLSMNLTNQKIVNRLLIHPSNPFILIAAASDGIWKTTDGGTNWTNEQAGWFTDLEFKPDDPNYIYASTLSNTGTSQIFRSTDGGNSWTQVTGLSGINRIDLAVTPSLPTVVSALCADQTGQGGMKGIYSSINNGASFTLALNGDCTNNMLGRKYNGDDCGGQGVYDIAYSIHPTNPDEIWVAGINNWKTADGGASWNINTMNTYDPVLNPVAAPYLHSDKHKIAYHPMNSDFVFTCSDAGLHVTNNGGATWYDLSDGLGISQMYKIGVSAISPDRVLCGLQDNGLKQKISTGWLEVMSGDNMEEIIDPVDEAVQYSCALTGILYRTLDNWVSREIIAYNIPGFTSYVTANGLGPGSWVTPFMLDPNNHQTLFIGYNDIFKSTDRGDTWSQISNFNSAATLKHISIAPSNSQVIYAATYDTLYVSGNGGAIWTYQTISTITGNVAHKISSITISPLDPLTLWVTISGFNAGNKVFKSINGGASWTNVSGTLPNIPINCMVYENGSNDGTYIGTDLGVFFKDNSLSDWIPYDNGLPNVQINELEISYVDNTLWAATYGRGLWKSDLFTVGINENNAFSNAVILYPNPSKGTFTLEIDNFEATKIEVYTAVGEIIHTAEIQANQTSIDLTDSAKGVYFVHIVSANANCIKKIIIEP